jgi:hypothetical protein
MNAHSLALCPAAKNRCSGRVDECQGTRVSAPPLNRGVRPHASQRITFPTDLSDRRPRICGGDSWKVKLVRDFAILSLLVFGAKRVLRHRKVTPSGARVSKGLQMYGRE